MSSPRQNNVSSTKEIMSVLERSASERNKRLEFGRGNVKSKNVIRKDFDNETDGLNAMRSHTRQETSVPEIKTLLKQSLHVNQDVTSLANETDEDVKSSPTYNK